MGPAFKHVASLAGLVKMINQSNRGHLPAGTVAVSYIVAHGVSTKPVVPLLEPFRVRTGSTSAGDGVPASYCIMTGTEHSRLATIVEVFTPQGGQAIFNAHIYLWDSVRR